MKFICTKENLAKTLSIITGIAGKNINLPILSNVLIKVLDQKVELIATNLELAVIAVLRAKVDEQGSFTVPAKTLYDFISLLSDEKVEIALSENELSVICGKSATKIKGTPADEFPVVPNVESEKGYLINGETLKNGLNQIIQSASRNDIRPELAGVLFDFNNNKNYLVLAATDSYRLAEKKIKLLQGEDVKKIIVPARTAQEMNKVLILNTNQEAEKNVRILVSDNQLVMRSGEVELISRLVEGQYPDYTQIIPKEFRTTAEFSVSQTAKEVKAASLFTTTGVNAITFDVKPSENSIGVSSVSAQTGEHKSEINAEIKGEKVAVFLNHRYVLDGLNNIQTETCVLKIVNTDSPCVFAPKDDESYLYIVMPIRQ
jgi:DNA polymerase-3 subunit beta